MLAMITAVLTAARHDNIGFISGFGSRRLLIFHRAIVIVLAAIAAHCTMAVLAAVHVAARHRFIGGVVI